MSDWFLEQGVIIPEGDETKTKRLSGAALRSHFYFATAPRDTRLFVAQKKNGIMSQLPAVWLSGGHQAIYLHFNTTIVVIGRTDLLKLYTFYDMLRARPIPL